MMPFQKLIPRILVLSLSALVSLPQPSYALRPAQSQSVRAGLEAALGSGSLPAGRQATQREVPDPDLALRPAAGLETSGRDPQAVFHRWDDAEGASIRAQVIQLFNRPEQLDDEYEDFDVKARFSESHLPVFLGPLPVSFKVEHWVRPGSGIVLVRAGPFFYVDQKEYSSMSSAGRRQLGQLLGGNLILIPNLKNSTISTYVGREAGKFGIYTFPTLANFLNLDLPERMVVAGSVDGDLLVALGALGVKYIEGFDILNSVVQESRQKLLINGYQDITEGPELKAGKRGFFNVFQGDLREAGTILSRLAFDGKETGFVSNIGTWPGLYEVTNADTMALMHSVDNVRLFVGAGYRKELGSEGFPRSMQEDQVLIQAQGWQPVQWATAFSIYNPDATVTWAAVPAAGLETDEPFSISETTDFALLRIGSRIHIPSPPAWIPDGLIITDRYPDREAVQLHQLDVGGRPRWNTSWDSTVAQLAQLQAKFHRPMTALEKQTDILDQGYDFRLLAGMMLEILRRFADPTSLYPRVRFDSIDDGAVHQLSLLSDEDLERKLLSVTGQSEGNYQNHGVLSVDRSDAQHSVLVLAPYREGQPATFSVYAGLETDPKQKAFLELQQLFRTSESPPGEKQLIGSAAITKYPDLLSLIKFDDLPILFEGNGENSAQRLIGALARERANRVVRYYRLDDDGGMDLDIKQTVQGSELEVVFLAEAEREQAAQGLEGFLIVMFRHLKIPEDRWNRDEQVAAIVHNLQTLASAGLEEIGAGQAVETILRQFERSAQTGAEAFSDRLESAAASADST